MKFHTRVMHCYQRCRMPEKTPAGVHYWCGCAVVLSIRSRRTKQHVALLSEGLCKCCSKLVIENVLKGQASAGKSGEDCERVELLRAAIFVTRRANVAGRTARSIHDDVVKKYV